MPTENQLYLSAIDGDERAFETICVDILPKLLILQRSRCHRYGIPEDQAEDIVQEAFQRAIPHLRSHRTLDFPDHYMSKVLLNVTRDWLRRRRSSRTQELPADLAAPLQDNPAIRAVHEAFERLDEHDRDILNLVLIEGHSPPDAAHKLGIGRWSAYKRYERALRRLRNILSDPD